LRQVDDVREPGLLTYRSVTNYLEAPCRTPSFPRSAAPSLGGNVAKTRGPRSSSRPRGVTKGTIYLYFENKEALFKAVVRQTIVPVIAQGEALARSFTGSARDLLEQLVREYWRLVGETALAGIPKLMMAEAATFPELTRFYYDEVVARGHRLMAGVIERGIQNGEFRPVDVMLAAKLAMSPLMHATVVRRAFASCMPEGFNIQAYLDTHIDLYLHGIAKP